MSKYLYSITALLLLSILLYSYFDYLRLIEIEKKLYQKHSELKTKNKIYKVSKYQELKQLYIKNNQKVVKMSLPKPQKSNFIFLSENWIIVLICLFFISILIITIYYFWSLKKKALSKKSN